MIQITYSHTFGYRFVLRYQTSGKMPVLPVILKKGKQSYSCVALVDTGAMFSLFDGQIAAVLGLNLTQGRLERLTSLGGPVTAYAHTIDFEIDLEINSQTIPFGRMEVLFSQQPVTRFILGRNDFLLQVQLGLSEKTEQIHLQRV